MSKSNTMNIINHFIKFCARELNMNVPPIKLVGSVQDRKLTFGDTVGKKVTVRITNRHPGDVCRTIAHEMVHAKLNNKSSSQAEEDKCNVMAGRIMRKYNTAYPQIFKAKPIMEDGVAANAMGGSSPSNPLSVIAQPERMLAPGVMKRKPKKLSDIFRSELHKEKRNGT